MSHSFEPAENYDTTKKRVGYVERADATSELYHSLGFKCGLEIHQQLKTDRKLFCRCPAGVYQDGDDYDAEIVRHMRPTLSELGEYDGTALMEFKTRKNITYRIKYETACTYDIDDTPPFPINQEALEIAIETALLLKLNIVGELHITRKQYLDGSIPTGFQRTGIVGIDGEIPLGSKKVRILQLSVEEDACREVSDIGHERVYTVDRLGMPLIETVTYPDMTTPEMAAEAGHYLRFLARSTGKVRTGIGAARQDVNVSVTGGTRVEIKGVSHISWIPALTHNEAYRQKALLEIRDELRSRAADRREWKTSFCELSFDDIQSDYHPLKEARANKHRLVAVNLPAFRGILSFFTQLGKTFANELSDRLKVIACLEKPNMIHCEQAETILSPRAQSGIAGRFGANAADAQIVFWCAQEDLKTALETVEERCRLAFEGVPNETRKALADGTTIFERVLPGPDRMYPDTDSAPIPIREEMIDGKRSALPREVHAQIAQLKAWKIPGDTHHYILRNSLMPIITRIIDECQQEPVFVGTVFGHTLNHLEGKLSPSAQFGYNKVYGLFKFVHDRNLDKEIVKEMLPLVYEHPNILFDSVLASIEYKNIARDRIVSYISTLKEKFRLIRTSKDPEAEARWIMGQARRHALGNVPLRELRAIVEKEIGSG